MGKVCAFFGHRDVRNEIYLRTEQTARIAIEKAGASQFWVGGYGAFDALAAAAVTQLKKEFPEISLYMILAYMPGADRPLPACYNGTIYPEGQELVPPRFAITRRNQWMASNCDMVIGCVDVGFGGAYAACRTAARKGKRLVNIGSFHFD